MNKTFINELIVLGVIPVLVLSGLFVFQDRSFILISLLIAVLALLPIFLSFEKKEANIRRMVMLATLVTLSVVGRFIFAAIPGFQPVTAIVVISAIFFGSEAGFMVGALSALISNIYFGQGPWTPFQMFAWGLIGFIAGHPKWSLRLKENRLHLVLYGVFAGMMYSLMMDVWTVMSLDGTFNFSRYVTIAALALPFMAVYAVSNVVFLLLAIKPVGEKLERLKTKYGM